ncbi:MAG: ACP S-malonyltransferase [Rickettsiales bacterium]|jgi:[acyl-carrier-protein] S-malonyltransferase|nr:ACP S-malonyltransferase [Rickettsiales bacterium]
MKTAFIFPGQGSQSVGMGKEFYDNFPVARQVFEEVDDALNQKLSDIIFNGSMEDLTLTANSQPAIMTTSIAILRSLQHETGKGIAELCDYVAGHSLGEYTALCAAESLSLSDAAKLVRLRGKTMQEAVAPGVGGMAAILGMDIESISKILEEVSGDNIVCQIANDNCPGQVVISGHMEAIEVACAKVIEAGNKAVKLPVSAPFHCDLMDPVKEVMAEALDNAKIIAPKVPLVANVLATEITDPNQIVDCLVEQISGVVRWTESVMRFKELSVENITEVGSGKVLNGMNKRIDRGFNLKNIQAIGDMDKSI